MKIDTPPLDGNNPQNRKDLSASDDESDNWATLVLNHGFVMSELRQRATKTTKIRKIAPPATQEFNGTLGDEQAQALRKELEQLPLTQSLAHMKTAMEQAFSPTLSSSELIGIYLSRFASQRNVMKPDKDYIDALSQALEAEKKHRDKVVFYHGCNGELSFFYDLIGMIRAQIQLINPDSFIAFRGTDLPFANFSSLDDFVDYYRNRNFQVNRYARIEKAIDYTDNYPEVALSVNPFLFGTDSNCISAYMGATYHYFYESRSQPGETLEELFKSMMLALGIPAEFTDYFRIFENHLKNNCRLFQIFIDHQVVDTVGYLSRSGGTPVIMSTNDWRSRGFARNLNKLREDLSKLNAIAETGESVNYQQLQGRLFLNPKVLHDPKAATICSYWRHKIDPKDEETYKNALRTQVSKDLEKWLRGKHEPVNKALQSPSKLKRLYSYVTSANGDNNSKDSESSFEMHRQLSFAVRYGDIETLKEIFEKHSNLKPDTEIEDLLGEKHQMISLIDVVPEQHFYSVLKFLIDKGLDPNTMSDGQSLLYKACQLYDKRAIDLLIEKGATCVQDAYGNTPLHQAARVSGSKCRTKLNFLFSSEQLKALLIKPENLRNSCGNTPLHVAIHKYERSDNSLAVLFEYSVLRELLLQEEHCYDQSGNPPLFIIFRNHESRTTIPWTKFPQLYRQPFLRKNAAGESPEIFIKKYCYIDARQNQRRLVIAWKNSANLVANE